MPETMTNRSKEVLMKRPRRFSRRSFIRFLAAGGTAIALEPFLSACSEQTTAPPVLPTKPLPLSLPTATTNIQSSPSAAYPALPTSELPAETPVQPTQAVSEQADLVVVHTDVSQEK